MRYGKEISLRLIGDKIECQKYIPRARTILGEVYNRDIEIGGLDQAWRRVELAEGVKITVHANQWMPLVTIEVPPAASTGNPLRPDILKLAWMPEGIVLTPVSEEYPDGRGLPNRTAVTIEATETEDEIPSGTVIEPVYGELTAEELELLLASNPETILLGAYGTDAGVWPQVLLNQYTNNKYLDEKGFISGLPESGSEALPELHPRRREAYLTPYATGGSFVMSWHYLFDPLVCVSEEYPDGGVAFWDDPNNNLFYGQEPGVYTFDPAADAAVAILTIPQFSDLLYTSAITEPESEQWYCHRPEEILYTLPASEGCFQETNRIRADVSRGPMYRQTRGHGSIAAMAVSEVALSGRMYHDDDQFRPGYFTQAGRGFNAVGRHLNLENLLLTSELAIGDEQSGRDAAIIWEGSPPHHANQVAAYWDDEDFPGAEHHVGLTEATVEDALYGGEIDPPIAGQLFCQGFLKKEWWLPPTTHHHENQYGVVGFFGSDQVWGREEFTENPFVTFGHHVYFLTQWYDDDDFRGVLGAAAYEQGGQLYLRMVIGVAPEADLDEIDGYMTIKVLTRNVRLTEQNPTYDCDWALEGEFTFLNSDGWYPYPNAQVKFAPDGTKFLFSMCKVTHSYSQGLDNGATNFTTDRSDLVRPRRTIQNYFIEYKYNEGSLAWQFEEDLEDSLTANITCATAGTENVYSRSVKGTVRMFADYDATGTIQYVTAFVDEMSYQRYNSSGPETENYGYRFRKLIFPSGKEVTYEQQYFQDVDSLRDTVDILNRGWPGDPNEGNFIRRISHLDVITEDIVYHHMNWDTTYLGKDTSGIFAYADCFGTEYVAMDLSFDDLETGTERLEEVLWEGSARAYAGYQFDVADNEDFIDSTNRDNGPYPNHIEMTHAKGVYCNDQCAQSHWASDAGGSWSEYRAVSPLPYLRFEDTTNGQPEVEIAMYKGVTPIDNLYGRPPFADYKVSCAPGLSLFGQGGDGDNAYVFGNPLVWGSTQTGNIAPLMAHDDNVSCKIVRYKDRLVLRHETVRIPFALAGAPTGAFSLVDAFYLDVPDDLKVLLYTNFNLDEAVGMTDVTDINPFGRL